METNKEEDSIMNVGKDFLRSIQRDLNEATAATKNGDYQSKRVALDCVNAKCSNRQTKEEEIMLKVINISLNTISGMYNKKVNKGRNPALIGQSFANILDEYEKAIIRVLDRIKWLVPHEDKIRSPF